MRKRCEKERKRNGETGGESLDKENVRACTFLLSRSEKIQHNAFN